MKKTTFGVKLGLLIRQKRKVLGLTQTQLAEDAYATSSKTRRISELENGLVADPHPTTIDPIIGILNISEAELAECAKNTDYSPDADLDRAYREAKNLLQIIATQFEHENPDASLSELEDFLRSKAQEFHALKEKIASIDGPVDVIVSLKEKASEALSEGQFEAVDELLIEAEEIQLTEKTLAQVRKQVEIRATRGSIFFMKADYEKALELYLSAADYFAPFSKEERGCLLNNLAGTIYELCRRSGEDGYSVAIKLLEAALSCDEFISDEQVAAEYNYKLALLYRNVSLLRSGTERKDLRGKCIEYSQIAARHARRVPSVYDLACANINIGNCLIDQAKEENDPKVHDKCIETFETVVTSLSQSNEYPTLLSTAYNSLGAALVDRYTINNDLSLEQCKEVTDVFKKAIVAAEQANDLEAWGAAQANFGVHSYRQARLEADDPRKSHFLYIKAISALNASLETYPTTRFPAQFAEINFMLAQTLASHASNYEDSVREGYLWRAMNSYHQAVHFYTETTNLERWTQIQMAVGIIFIQHAGLNGVETQKNDYEQAQEIFKNILKVNQKNLPAEAKEFCEEHLSLIEERLKAL